MVNDCPSDKLLSPGVMLESKGAFLFLDKCLKSLRYLEWVNTELQKICLNSKLSQILTFEANEEIVDKPSANILVTTTTAELIAHNMHIKS